MYKKIQQMERDFKPRTHEIKKEIVHCLTNPGELGFTITKELQMVMSWLVPTD